MTGQLLACRLTAGNVDDRVPVPQLTRWLWGKLFGDKGYLSQPLTEQLLQRGIHLVTRLKSKMKNRLILLADKLLLRKRSILETIIDQLKNISQIEHTRHRSMANFMVNLVGLIAYSHQPSKPSLPLISSTRSPYPELRLPTLVCDGCGQTIDMDYYIHITPVNQQLLQEYMAVSSRTSFLL